MFFIDSKVAGNISSGTFCPVVKYETGTAEVRIILYKWPNFKVSSSFVIAILSILVLFND